MFLALTNADRISCTSSTNAAEISCWVCCRRNCLTVHTQTYARTFACQLILYPRHIICDVTLPSVKSRESTKVNIQYGKSETRKRGMARSEAAEGASGARGAFMEGLRFRRLAHEQECYWLTAEWEPGESMIETACQRSLCRSCLAFFSASEDNGNREESTPVRLRWKLS